MKHLPSWFPGAGFKRSAVEWKKLIEAFVNEPYEDCRQKIVSHLPSSPARMLTSPRMIQRNGTAAPSFTSLAFDKNENMTEQEDFDLRWTTNSMYTASIDTVRSRSSALHPCETRRLKFVVGWFCNCQLCSCYGSTPRGSCEGSRRG